MRIDGPSRCFVANDRISRLSPTQAVLVRVLVDNRDRFVTHDELAIVTTRDKVFQELGRIRRMLAHHGLTLTAERGKGCRIVNAS